jgi:hypothetical protein
MLRNFLFAASVLLVSEGLSQASLSTIGTPYTQNFNSLPNTTDGAAVAGWANNTYLTGWYVSTTAPIVEATCGPTAASVNNTGGAYVIASGTDRNLGSRASGGTGTVRLGLRLVNSTGTTITSLYVEYYGEQWSIAENGTNVNSLAFSYQSATTVTSLTAGTWTNASALDFTQIYTSSQSSGLGGTACTGTGAQCLALNGNASTNRTLIQACISVSVAPGEEIMLRWSDVDNAGNDHHLQIDDVSVTPYDVSCATVLPVEFTAFTAELYNGSPLLRWSTASETNNARFVIERTTDGEVFEAVGEVAGAGTTTQPRHYSYFDITAPAGVLYYRLRQIDFNGDYDFSQLRAVQVDAENKPALMISPVAEGVNYVLRSCEMVDLLEVWNASGQLIYRQQDAPATGNIPLHDNGLFLIRARTAGCRADFTERIMLTAR